MTMTEQQNQLFREWREDRPGMVTDGVVDESAYLNSKLITAICKFRYALAAFATI